MAPRRTEMSPHDKGKILAYMEIFNATQIAKKMGRDPTTIRRFINKYKETGNIENLPRTGRPPALNNDEKDALTNEVIKNRRIPIHEVINTLDLNCSLTTAKKTLHEAGIYSHVAAKKPFISTGRNKKYRTYEKSDTNRKNSIRFSANRRMTKFRRIRFFICPIFLISTSGYK